MGTILTVSGPAGGVGKTTVAVNLAAALALYEKKVLVVDCDPLRYGFIKQITPVVRTCLPC
jgi:cellulose biosynthesis protein BcsQ